MHMEQSSNGVCAIALSEDSLSEDSLSEDSLSEDSLSEAVRPVRVRGAVRPVRVREGVRPVGWRPRVSSSSGGASDWLAPTKKLVTEPLQRAFPHCP